MLRKIIQNSSKTILISNRSFAAATQTKPKDKYDLFAAVLIERLPIISKKLNEIENEVMEMLKTIEFEQSLKSDHELRKEKEKRQADSIKSGKLEVDSESDSIVLQTAQDFEDASLDESSKFIPASRITEDDEKNNVKSLNRKLDDTLMFFCEQQLGKDKKLLLPQGKWQEGETLRQTAERIVKENCGTDIKVHFYGNSPVGFYKYKYPAKENHAIGAKIFFYRAIYKGGNISNEKLKFEWISGNEMQGKVKNSYYDAVQSFCTF